MEKVIYIGCSIKVDDNINELCAQDCPFLQASRCKVFGILDTIDFKTIRSPHCIKGAKDVTIVSNKPPTLIDNCRGG